MATRRARAAEARSMLVGAVVLAVFGACLYVAIFAFKGLPGQSYTYAKVAFGEVGALLPGDDVRINSLRAGQVHGIELVDGAAVVEVQLDGDRPLYRDARAAIQARSGLGQKFLELNPGTEGAGPLGSAVLPAAQTVDSNELDDLLDVFDGPTRDAAASTLREVGGGLTGRSEDLADALTAAPHLLHDLGEISTAASSDQTDLVGLMRSGERLAARFSGKEQHIAQLVDQLDSTLRAVAVDGGVPLQDTLRAAPGTLTEARRAFEALEAPLADTQSAMAALQPGAAALGEATPDLRGVLREGVDPLQQVPGVAEAAEPAVRDLTQTVADARPLAPEFATTLGRARTPLEALAPYSPEIGLWFTYTAQALSYGDESGHYLRIAPLLAPETVSGSALVDDPTVHRNPYPAPGEAQTEKTGVPR
ncbi:MlaD family protein [Pseudonocardia bannensis]|uniref:MCE family protein n=1 Tax=Pseudonocardia bannensis TaxID=630973 RepID=A0A848DFS1_9PSEU|nr:MlaD family protein [Pseudonocardia bannensis]NMH91415.1 MCE family protein [Pseudonocardia bannensis]